MAPHAIWCRLSKHELVLGPVQAGTRRSMPRSLWHTLLAIMRLPKSSTAFRLTIVTEHVLAFYPLVLLFVFAASPKSASLTAPVRALMYICVGRADVDISPTAWHMLFMFFLAYGVALCGALAWVHTRGRSLVR